MYIGACDTGTVNAVVVFLNVNNFHLHIFKHNLKVNHAEEFDHPVRLERSMVNILEQEIMTTHKEYFERCLFFGIELNHVDVIYEVKLMLMNFHAMLRGRYVDMPVHFMAPREVRSSYSIPPDKSHKQRKLMSGMSGVFTETQMEVIANVFGKVDDVFDACNLVFALYRKFYLAPSYPPNFDWQEHKVEQIIAVKRQRIKQETESRKRQKQT